MKPFFSSSLVQGLNAEHTIISVSKRSYSPSVCCLHCSLQVIDYDWEKKCLLFLPWPYSIDLIWVLDRQHQWKMLAINVWEPEFTSTCTRSSCGGRFVIKALRVGMEVDKLWRFSASQAPVKCQTLGSVIIPRLKKCGLNDWGNHLTFISCL